MTLDMWFCTCGDTLCDIQDQILPCCLSKGKLQELRNTFIDDLARRILWLSTRNGKQPIDPGVSAMVSAQLLVDALNDAQRKSGSWATLSDRFVDLQIQTRNS